MPRNEERTWIEPSSDPAGSVAEARNNAVAPGTDAQAYSSLPA